MAGVTSIVRIVMLDIIFRSQAAKHPPEAQRGVLFAYLSDSNFKFDTDLQD